MRGPITPILRWLLYGEPEMGLLRRSATAFNANQFIHKREALLINTRLFPVVALCLVLGACNAFHGGPGASDIDAAVRRALDQANSGPVNSLIGRPLPTSADVESVKSDDDCTKTGDTAFVCKVSLVRRSTQPGSAGTVLHAELVFAKDAGGNWQTSGIDEALAVGTAKSVINQVTQALPGHAASD
jgi:hypothetical protein